MANEQTKAIPAEDPKKGKPKAQQSKTRFPYYDLSDSVKVAHAIHVDAGGMCNRTQLAALLDHTSVRSGAFLSRVASAKMYGLVEQAGGAELRLTERGKAIVAPVDPQTTAKAKLDAFFAVELFRKVYDQYEGSTLPNNVGLENLFGTSYGIVKSRRAPTVRVMLSSAESAGLFATAGRSQMVKPVGLHASVPAPQEDRSASDGAGHAGDESTGNRAGGGAVQDAGHIDPAIAGLLRRLPPSGRPLSAEKRKRLIDAFTSVVAWIYPEEEDS